MTLGVRQALRAFRNLIVSGMQPLVSQQIRVNESTTSVDNIVGEDEGGRDRVYIHRTDKKSTGHV